MFRSVLLLFLAACCLSVYTSVSAFTTPSVGLKNRVFSRSAVALSKLRCKQDDVERNSLSRREILLQAGLLAVGIPSSAHADLFGGQIGWGDAQKAGVQWGGGFSNPLTSQSNDFRAEVVNGKGSPVIISFEKPKKWKVSTNAGITIQDYITSDSAFVIVAPCASGVNDLEDLDPQYALDKVFDVRGRYGTFGKVDAITISKRKVETEGASKYLYVDFKFTTLSPGSREIDRNGCLKIALVDGDLVMFTASSNSNRWKKVKEDIAKSVTSYIAIAAPKTNLKGSQIESGIGNYEALGVAGYDLLRYDSPVWSK